MPERSVIVMKPNIVLIIADCLRKDRVGCYGYNRNNTPNLDRLAEGGKQYENVISTGSWTVPAHGSLFTGMYPSEHGNHAQNKYFSSGKNKTLAGQLSDIGYNSVGFSTNPWVTTNFGFDEGFDEFYDIKPRLPFDGVEGPKSEFRNTEFKSAAEKWTEVVKWILSGNPIKRTVNGAYQQFYESHPISTAETVRSHITDWIDNRNDECPFFLFANVMDIHEPYRIHRESMDLLNLDTEITELPNIKWNLDSLSQGKIDESSKEMMDSIYDSSIRYFDSQLDSLLTSLSKRNVLEDTIVIVSSDHGQSLGENGFWGHGTFLYDELVNIPLIVSGPENYLKNWPNTSHTHSLAELPYYLLGCIGESFVSHSTVLSNTSKKKINGENKPVIAESHGLHEVGDYSVNIPNDGYRRTFFNHQSILRELDNKSIISKTDKNHTDIKSFENTTTIEKLESEITANLNISELEENVADIDTNTQQRLEDLGYM
jgi:arylsulfatase A-like enzyme